MVNPLFEVYVIRLNISWIWSSVGMSVEEILADYEDLEREDTLWRRWRSPKAGRGLQPPTINFEDLNNLQSVTGFKTPSRFVSLQN
jgi:hypothetical protein